MRLILLLLFINVCFAEEFDRSEVTFGIEYSFQDQEMVNEPGRNTGLTPHKEKKIYELAHRFQKISKTQIEDLGFFIYLFHSKHLGGYEAHVDPVCIEFKTSPFTIDETIQRATPIFEAAEKTGLVPYVNPAAERSGMGHIHVGGSSLATNPFYKYPNLLRNVLVFFHQHPSLMYGFAEAWDIGHGSNIETFHSKDRFEALTKVIQKFDELYLDALPGERHHSLYELLNLIDFHQPGWGSFVEHYRAINLEHIVNVFHSALKPEATGKITVEFRMFRPQKSPEHAKANLDLLLDVFAYLSRPDFLVPLDHISERSALIQWNPTKIQEDWKIVKELIGHKNPLSDQMIQELINISREVPSPIEGAKMRLAFSRKENKGFAYEILIPDNKPLRPKVDFVGETIYLERIKVNGEKFWIGRVDVASLPGHPKYNLGHLNSLKIVEWVDPTNPIPEPPKPKGFIFRCLSALRSLF